MVIYLDSGSLEDIEIYGPRVAGFTTNPTLLKKSGIADYAEFAHEALKLIWGRPISFEVFADEMEDMEYQARTLSSWGENIYVKIPVTNTKGFSCRSLIHRLSLAKVKLNVTAVMTFEQINTICRSLHYDSILSIFCGRIADTGRDPLPFITRACAVTHSLTRILWASAREILNIKQAGAAGADIITLGPELLKKLRFLDKDLQLFSLETVRQFHEDGKEFKL